jgi:hypothetical protein
MWKEQLAAFRATEGDTDKSTLDAICSLAELYKDIQRFKEVPQSRKEELIALQAAKGDTDNPTLDGSRSLHRYYMDLGRYEKAWELKKEFIQYSKLRQELFLAIKNYPTFSVPILSW